MMKHLKLDKTKVKGVAVDTALRLGGAIASALITKKLTDMSSKIKVLSDHPVLLNVVPGAIGLVLSVQKNKYMSNIGEGMVILPALKTINNFFPSVGVGEVCGLSDGDFLNALPSGNYHILSEIKDAEPLMLTGTDDEGESNYSILSGTDDNIDGVGGDYEREARD